MEKIKQITWLLIMALITEVAFAQVNQVDAKGRKQGAWQKTYPNIRAYEYKGQFKDDKPVGTFTYYYPSTKVKAIVKHDENSNRSASYMYHEGGTLLAFGIYRNQKKDSVWTHFGPSGRLSFKETYKDGQLNGTKTIYYVPENVNDRSEKVAKVMNYKNGKENGEVIEYFDFGGIKSRSTYLDGQRHGLCVTNHTNGQPMIQERYKFGIRNGYSMAFDESGKEIGRKYYRMGSLLEGEALDKWLEECKKKGVNPNN